METLPKDPFFEFRPNTLQDVRKEFNLDRPGAMEDVVKNFEQWVQKQNHFTKKDFTNHFLEASIILSKGSLEKAKKNLDKLCTMKTLIPKFFSKYNVRKEMVDSKNIVMSVLMPKLTTDNYRIYLLKVLTSDIDPAALLDQFKTNILMCEYRKAHDYAQGVYVVVDLRNINIINLTMKLNMLDLRDFLAIVVEGYTMRIKALHFISESKAVHSLISLVKQVVSEKVKNRFHVHKTVDSIYEHVDKDMLPKEYGGKEKITVEIYDEFLDLLSTEKNVAYFKDICQSGTNEELRQTASYNNEILGMPGSFRKLTVD